MIRPSQVLDEVIPDANDPAVESSVLAVGPDAAPSSRPALDRDEQKLRNQRVIELLDAWLADQSGYDEKVWPQVKEALEENRLSHRRKFRD
jgi:hypothetical protein